jgi:hypothetical protein
VSELVEDRVRDIWYCVCGHTIGQHHLPGLVCSENCDCLQIMTERMLEAIKQLDQRSRK